MKRLILQYHYTLLIFFISLFTIFHTTSIVAQVEIGVTTGFQWGGSVDFVQGESSMGDGQNFMVHLTIEKTPWAAIELSYSRLNEPAKFRAFGFYAEDFPSFTSESGLVEYYQIGGLKLIEIRSERIKPFGLFSLGATRFKYFNIVNSDGEEFGDSDDVWRFSIALGGGIKIMLGEKVGLRVQGRLLMPMEFNGVGGYLGIGTGGPYSGISLNSVVAPLQGDISGGIFFRLGD